MRRPRAFSSRRTRSPDELLVAETNAATNSRLARQKTKRRQPGHRFAATGFTDEADGFTFFDREIDAVQKLRAVEGDRQIGDFH